jgi:dCMP deaminase
MRKVIQENGKISVRCLRTVHAEQNAICQAAKKGFPLRCHCIYENDSLPDLCHAADQLWD